MKPVYKQAFLLDYKIYDFLRKNRNFLANDFSKFRSNFLLT